jgi:uncharacterized membrane protein
LKENQRRKLNEKKVKGASDGAKAFSGLDEEKTIILTILVALMIIAGLLVNLALKPTTEEGFEIIYVLDSEKGTNNFPKAVILGENSTFSLWVGVENQNGVTMNCSVLVKVDDGTVPIGSDQAKPTESYNKILLNEELWEFPVTVTINQLGYNRVLFELWVFEAETMNYTGKYAKISVEAY